MSDPQPQAEPFPPVSPAATVPGPTINAADPMPDHTRADEPPDTRQAPRRPGLKLGQNKRPRSGVRALTKQDAERLENWYTGLALMLAPINRGASMAIADNTEKCVEAWMDLAAQNDRVRRFLLGILEGGAWSKVIGAHMPILYAAIPPEMWLRMPGLAGIRPPVESEGE